MSVNDSLDLVLKEVIGHLGREANHHRAADEPDLADICQRLQLRALGAQRWLTRSRASVMTL